MNQRRNTMKECGERLGEAVAAEMSYIDALHAYKVAMAHWAAQAVLLSGEPATTEGSWI